jgi:hypothetical protein
MENDNKKPETVNYDDVKVKYDELLSDRNKLIEMIKKFPNDMDLGKKIRGEFQPK